MASRSGRGSGGGGLVAALLVGAGVLGAVWLAIAKPGVRRVRRPTARPAGGPPPTLLRQSILGADKQMVQAVFGPPKAAGGVPAIPDQGRQAYWDADTWYYALDPARKMAMAIRFEKGVARQVDFVQG